MFNENTQIFQEALDKSGYSYKLKFNPQDPKQPPKNKNRKRDVTCMNKHSEIRL